ncbi:unnamed protein product [Callosobruchus maculatus]|nr:unnamed protein product [Callosobruchus maculatus]
MKMKFGRHHRPCIHGFDEFHPHMGEMSRFGNHGMMKCKKGNHQHKDKHMLKEFFRMMMASSSESEESGNEETDQEATQGTGQIPTVEAGQEATQTGETDGQEEHATCGSRRSHHGRMMRCGRHHHGCSKDKFKMKFGKGDGHKDKVIWKCKKNKFQHKGRERCKSMRAMFMDMMCSDRRGEMWDGFFRMMTEQEIDTGVEGKKDLPNEETNQEAAGQSSTNADPTGTEEGNQKDPQSSGAKDDSV